MKPIRRAKQLDSILREGTGLASPVVPTNGWLYAIRTALGMPRSIIAKRLNISGPAVQQIEKREADRTITLGSLQTAAEALGCQFIYAIVPKKPLAQMLKDSAEQAAKKMMAEVSQTMKLEDQEIQVQASRDTYEDLVEELERHPKTIWKKIE